MKDAKDTKTGDLVAQIARPGRPPKYADLQEKKEAERAQNARRQKKYRAKKDARIEIQIEDLERLIDALPGLDTRYVTEKLTQIKDQLKKVV